MKISRRHLRKTIKEFLDTSYRPSSETIQDVEALQSKPTVFDQVSNSERAAFIAAMGIAEKSHESMSLNEGDVIKFPTADEMPKARGSARYASPHEDEDEDPVGPVYTIQPHGTDLPGDTANLEADEEDMTPREIQMLRQIMGQKRSLSQRTRADDVQDMEDEIEDLADAYMLGNLTDLFADEGEKGFWSREEMIQMIVKWQNEMGHGWVEYDVEDLQNMSDEKLTAYHQEVEDQHIDWWNQERAEDD